jgi:hypothetical protein
MVNDKDISYPSFGDLLWFLCILSPSLPGPHAKSIQVAGHFLWQVGVVGEPQKSQNGVYRIYPKFIARFNKENDGVWGVSQHIQVAQKIQKGLRLSVEEWVILKWLWIKMCA